MDIKILREEKNLIEFEIENEDHTLCNILKDALLRDSNVEVAAYSMDHPLVKKVKMIVSIKKGDVRATLNKAVDTVKSETKELKSAFKNL